MRYVLPFIVLLMLISCKENEQKKPVTEAKNENTMTERFTPVSWLHNTNIYEVNLRQYTTEGTFNAFAQHLTRLRDMGVETLWFMPITPIAEKNRKGSMGSYYACSDYTSINPEFGTLDDFKALVKQAHGMGFKVIIDWVANHTGWDHIWTKEHPEYYLMDSATNDFQIASGMDDIIELDFSNKDLRKAMKDAMAYWVKECDIDGFRCDLAFWVELDFWKEARPELDAIKPLLWLGEFDELENPEYGEAFDASYCWTWMHKTKEYYEKKQPVDTLVKLLKRYDDLGDNTMRAWFTTNHDENTWNGTEYEKYGNMAKPLAVFSATWNGVPLLYSGQELPNKKRLEFFEKDPIEWTGNNELEGFYRTLLNLHSAQIALRGGDPTVQTFQIKTDKAAHVLAYLRRKENREVLVILNFSDQNLDAVKLLSDELTGTFQDVFTGAMEDISAGKTFELPAWGYRVFSK